MSDSRSAGLTDSQGVHCVENLRPRTQFSFGLLGFMGIRGDVEHSFTFKSRVMPMGSRFHDPSRFQNTKEPVRTCDSLGASGSQRCCKDLCPSPWRHPGLQTLCVREPSGSRVQNIDGRNQGILRAVPHGS